MQKIVSGGQTGVDRAALDVALQASFPCGGWCPRGRIAEDGSIDARYPLQEASSRDYTLRTEWNVRDSDGTLILARGRLVGGTALTRSLARRLGKPVHVVDLVAEEDAQSVVDWLEDNNIQTLNVAGPRESQNPRIYDQAAAYLRRLLAKLQDDSSLR